MRPKTSPIKKCFRLEHNSQSSRGAGGGSLVKYESVTSARKDICKDKRSRREQASWAGGNCAAYDSASIDAQLRMGTRLDLPPRPADWIETDRV
jgi:hypothetical protein